MDDATGDRDSKTIIHKDHSHRLYTFSVANTMLLFLIVARYQLMMQTCVAHIEEHMTKLVKDCVGQAILNIICIIN